MNPPIHVGFLARDFLKWGGGVWFIQNLLRGLAALPPEVIRITVLVPVDDSSHLSVRRIAGRLKRALLDPTRAREQLFPSMASEHALWTRGFEQLKAIIPAMTLFDGSDADLMRRCAAMGIDVLLPTMAPLSKSLIPWVGYLYDCQHKHYPQFFRAAEIARRDQAFAAMLRRGTVVFANAQAVTEDLREFFPESKAELFSLPFAPLILEEELAATIREAPAAQRAITGDAPYFIVCNQFWIHKDHATAFRAFARFLQEPSRRHWRLVCTGLTQDYRVPGHFDRLKALISELSIADRVIFTGYIERSRQQALLYGAAALLQPTLFEGGPGGGAASDAIALGVPCLLSDIAVNRELSDPLASFFAVGDPESLAAAMEAMTTSPSARPGTAQLLDNSRRHARQLGEALRTLAERALAA